MGDDEPPATHCLKPALQRTLALLVALLAMGCTHARLELMTPEELPSTRARAMWDGRERNVLYVRHHDWNSTFGMHLFEDLLVPTHSALRFKNNRRLDANRFQWTRDGADLVGSFSQSDPVGVEIRMRVRALANRVVVTGSVTNTGDVDWRGASPQALMCFRTRLNPEFADENGERIHVWKRREGREVSVYELLGRGESPYFHFNVNTPDSELLPVIRKADREGRRRLTVFTDPPSTLLGNRHPGMSCIHANLALPLAPGETLDFRTELISERPRMPILRPLADRAPRVEKH